VKKYRGWSETFNAGRRGGSEGERHHEVCEVHLVPGVYKTETLEVISSNVCEGWRLEEEDARV
jgi:hypothetical protein